jgi:hypothetical protein
MTCGLIRLRCEMQYRDADGNQSDWLKSDTRVFDCPPQFAGKIKAWYEARGWDVTEEQL